MDSIRQYGTLDQLLKTHRDNVREGVVEPMLPLFVFRVGTIAERDMGRRLSVYVNRDGINDVFAQYAKGRDQRDPDDRAKILDDIMKDYLAGQNIAVPEDILDLPLSELLVRYVRQAKVPSKADELSAYNAVVSVVFEEANGQLSKAPKKFHNDNPITYSLVAGPIVQGTDGVDLARNARDCLSYTTNVSHNNKYGVIAVDLEFRQDNKGGRLHDLKTA